jgi:hypothetical protein
MGNKIKEAFMDMLKNDLKRLVLFSIFLGTVFLYIIGTLFPFVVGNILINGRVSYFQFTGSKIIVLLLFLLVLYYAYIFLLKPKAAKKIYLIIVIYSFLMFAWGILIQRVGLTGSSNGFGKILMFLMLIMMIFLHFGEKLYNPWVDKFVLALEKDLNKNKEKKVIIEEKE